MEPKDIPEITPPTLLALSMASSLWAPVPVRTPPTPRTQRAHVPKLVSMWDKEAKTRMRFFVCLFDDIYFKNMLHTSDEQH